MTIWIDFDRVEDANASLPALSALARRCRVRLARAAAYPTHFRAQGSPLAVARFWWAAR